MCTHSKNNKLQGKYKKVLKIKLFEVVICKTCKAWTILILFHKSTKKAQQKKNIY